MLVLKTTLATNQAHAEGAAAMAANVPGIKLVEEASVPRNHRRWPEAMRSMIEIDGGQRVLFPTLFWRYFDPYILELATEFPDVAGFSTLVGFIKKRRSS